MRFPRRSAFASSVALGVALKACSSFEDATPPTGDAGIDTGSSPDADIAVDGAADGSVDTGNPLDAGPFCKPDSAAILCDDFDDSTRVVWTDTFNFDGGFVEVLSGGGAASPPGYLHTHVEPAPTAACAFESKSFYAALPVPKGLRGEVKMRLGRPLLNGEVLPTGPYFGIKNTTTGVECRYYIQVVATGPRLVSDTIVDGGEDAGYLLLGKKLGPSVYQTVALDVGGDAGQRRITVSFDGDDAGSTAIVPACQQANQLVFFSVGLHCAGDTLTSAVDVTYDDVLVTAN